MKKILVGMLVALASFAAAAQTVDVKGIRIGMTKAEFNQLYPNGIPKDWTIAGVSSKFRHSSIDVKFHNGILDTALFFFDASEFEQIRNALSSKYPKLNCRKTPVQTRMGANFSQEECGINNGELNLVKFLGDITTGALIMESQRYKAASKHEEQAKNADV